MIEHVAWYGVDSAVKSRQRDPTASGCDHPPASRSTSAHMLPESDIVRQCSAVCNLWQSMAIYGNLWQSQQPQFRKTWETARPRNDEQTNPRFLQTSRFFINFHTFSDTPLFMPYAMPPVQTRCAKNSSAPPSRRRLSGGHAPWRQPWEIQQGFFLKHRKHTQTKIVKNTKTHSRLENLKHIWNTDASERNHKKS